MRRLLFSLILIYPLLLLCGLNHRVNRTGAYLFSRSVLPLLLATSSPPFAPKYPPTLIFTGATASVRGSANFSSFATGKFALRALSQSLAREFGPKGVHVAHAIIDGVIDIPRTKEWVFKDEDAKIGPDAVSDLHFIYRWIPLSCTACVMLTTRIDRRCILVSAHAAEDDFHA